jgi:hypothetical protein
VIDFLRESGGLRREFTHKKARDIFDAGGDVYRMLVGNGVVSEQYQDWLETLVDALLGHGAAAEYG